MTIIAVNLKGLNYVMIQLINNNKAKYLLRKHNIALNNENISHGIIDHITKKSYIITFYDLNEEEVTYEILKINVNNKSFKYNQRITFNTIVVNDIIYYWFEIDKDYKPIILTQEEVRLAFEDDDELCFEVDDD